MSFKRADKVWSTKSAIISLYPTGVSGIIVLINTKHHDRDSQSDYQKLIIQCLVLI